MNTLPEAPDAPEVEAIDSAAPAEKPKPVRRRRATATVEQPAASAVVAAEPAESAEPAAATAPKPRRRKVPAKAAESEAAPADAAPAATVEPTAPAARKPAHEPVVEAPAPAATAAPVEAAAPRAEAVSAGAAEGSAGASAEAPAEASADGAAIGPDGEPRGERSRRRNRRDRRRGEGRPGRENRDGAPAAEGEAEAAPAGPAMPDTGELFAHVLSGAFDADEATEPAAEEPAAHRRVLAPEPESPKLHKVLAQAGIGSRRDMEEMILEGRISVNGQPAHIGQRISFGDQVKVNGKPVRFRIVPPPPRVIAYHKPVGEVVTHDDPQQRPTVFRRLPRLQQGKWQSVGRLDINTEGLLLFTNSGELANQLMHPRFGVEREYAVRVLGTLNEEQKARLLEGVEIEGQTAGFRSIEDGGGEGANHWYRVVITEGRNREVRKLFDAVGLAVSRLIRIRYGTVVLPRGLKRGVWVDLEENDVRTIRRLAGGDRQQPQQGQQGQQRDNNERRGERGDARGNEPRNDRQGKKQRGDNRGQQGGDRPRQPAAQPQQGQQAQQASADRRDDDDFEDGLDIDPSRIPNPLEQTFDKRFVQKPRSGVGGRGFSRGGGGFGAGGSAPAPASKKRGGPQQPDPMQTSVGYIGADAFHRKNRGGRGGGGGGGGGFGGGGGGFGGGGRKGR